MEESKAAYVGLPLREDSAASQEGCKYSHLFDVPPVFSHVVFYSDTYVSDLFALLFKAWGGYGFLAFIVSAFLAGFAWVANQGWTIISILVFGQFEWTIESAWKHVLLSAFGSIITAIAFLVIFSKIFIECRRDGEDNDVPDALRDLGELGFVVGYFCSQTFFTGPLYGALVAKDLGSMDSGLNGATVVGLLLWMLSTKMRDYCKAEAKMKRCEISLLKHSNVRAEPSDYVLIV